MYKELWLISRIWDPGVALGGEERRHEFGSPGAMQPCRSRPSYVPPLVLPIRVLPGYATFMC